MTSIFTHKHYAVRGGDIVHMHGDCQQRFQHSLLKDDKTATASMHREGRGVGEGAEEGEREIAMRRQGVPGGRVSLVFKKSLPGSGARDTKPAAASDEDRG